MDDRRWVADAACLDAPVEIFFDFDAGARQQARRICASCPVRSECLAYALTHGYAHGIWGGKDETERLTILDAIRQAAPHVKARRT